MIFDTHAHYEDEQFNEDRELILASMKENGVGRIVDVGSSVESTKAAVELAGQYDFIYAAVGIHPEEVGDIDESHMEWLKSLTEDEKVVAIGEIGLDYHYEDPVRDIQKVWFERQLELAHKVNLPVCIHSREAAKDTLDIMKKHHAEELGGVIHCFSYSTEDTECAEYLQYAPTDKHIQGNQCDISQNYRKKSFHLNYLLSSTKLLSART